MGEIAEDMLDDLYYHADAAALGEGFFDRDGYWPPAIVCKYCGKQGLNWAETDSGWRLENDHGQLHSCAAYRKGK